MLTRTGKRIRTGLTAVFVVLLLVGTLIGQDDDFPFGPFRMYSTTADPNGTVISTRVEAIDATGRVLVVSEGATGLRRAEIEGQIERFVADPSLLAEVSRAHDRLRPDEPRYDAVRVVVARYALRDHQPVGDVTDEVLVTWERP